MKFFLRLIEQIINKRVAISVRLDSKLKTNFFSTKLNS